MESPSVTGAVMGLSGIGEPAAARVQAGPGDRGLVRPGVGQGNTRPTQPVLRGKINTGTTRTKRHFPAHRGTAAKIARVGS